MSVGVKIESNGLGEFRSAIKDLDQSLKVLGSEMKVVTSEFGKNDKSVDGLTAKNKVLNQQIENQRKKVDTLQGALAKAKAEYGDNSKEVAGWTIDLNKAKAKLNDMEREVKQNDDAINGLGDEMEKTGKKTSTFGDVLKANLTSQAIIGGLKAISREIIEISRSVVNFAADGVKLASDLGEVQNVVDTTFGKNAESIDKFAKSAASAYGLSELAAKQYTGTLGAMLKSMGLTDGNVLSMSKDMVGLAGDMASFYNLDTAEAFEKIRSGISGETEPLKQLGINMSVVNLQAFAAASGVKKTYNSMTQGEQAILRYKYLMKVTADAQGDFAKTSDGFANQQRILQLNVENLKAALGQKLLPTVTQVVSDLNKLLEGEITVDEFFDDISKTIDANLPDLISKAGKFVEEIGGAILENLPELLNVAAEMLEAFVKAFFTLDNLYNISKTATDLVLDLATDILNATGQKNVIDALGRIGGAIVQGIWDSLKQHWRALWYGDDNPIANSSFGHASGSGGGGKGGGGFGSIGSTGFGRGYASGLDYVPYDDFKAYLHKGEMVLPAIDAQALRGVRGGLSASSTTVNHTGTIHVEGVNSQGELEAVAEFVVEKIARESRLI